VRTSPGDHQFSFLYADRRQRVVGAKPFQQPFKAFVVGVLNFKRYSLTAINYLNKSSNDGEFDWMFVFRKIDCFLSHHSKMQHSELLCRTFCIVLSWSMSIW
jgi:hypothetical protein